MSAVTRFWLVLQLKESAAETGIGIKSASRSVLTRAALGRANHQSLAPSDLGAPASLPASFNRHDLAGRDAGAPRNLLIRRKNMIFFGVIAILTGSVEPAFDISRPRY